MKALLNAHMHLGVAPKDLDDFRVRPLDGADRPGQELGLPGKTSVVVRRPEEGYAAGRTKDALEVLLGSLPRCDQGLPQLATD